MEVSKETENDLMKKKKMHFSFVVSYKLKFYTFACQSFFLNKQFLYIHILIKKEKPAFSVSDSSSDE